MKPALKALFVTMALMAAMCVAFALGYAKGRADCVESINMEAVQ